MIKSLELRQKYVVYGKYGKENIGGRMEPVRKESYICRGSGLSISEVQEMKTDAVVVLVNPGKRVKTKDLPEDGWKQIAPDLAQVQLIRLMEKMEWNKVTILQLFDVCAGKVEDFILLLTICEHSDIAYSRFQTDLQGCREEITSAEHLLFAWGARPEAKRLATAFGLYPVEEAKKNFGKHPVAVWDVKKGYPKHPFQYKPDLCDQWVEDMATAIDNKSISDSTNEKQIETATNLF